MKNSTNKILKAAVCAGIAAAGAGYALVNVIDNLLVKRKWTVPEKFGDMVSGADISNLKEESRKNMMWLSQYGYETYAMNSDNGQKLMAYLMKSETPSDIYVFCSHGYRSDGKGEYCGFAQYYLSRGINVFMVDHVAAGKSEGKYIGFGHYEYKDALKWLDFMKDTFGRDIKIIVHGVSMGAATVMLMSGSAALPDNVKMIVSDCGYTSAWDEFSYKLHDLGLPSHPTLDIVNAVNRRKAGYDFRDTDALESVKHAKVPMLFVHGGADTFVPTYMVTQLFYACASEEKDILIVDGADHAQSFIDGKKDYEAKLDEFIGKYVAVESVKNQ